MTPAETAAFLRRYNEWRRDDEDISQFDVCKISEAIDAAVEMIGRIAKMEAEVRDRNEFIARLQNELRGYREREKTMGWKT